MVEIVFNERSLAQLSVGQHVALLKIIERNKTLTKIHVTTAFDLPSGYIAFNQFFGDGRNIYGGISPEGEVST